MWTRLQALFTAGVVSLLLVSLLISVPAASAAKRSSVGQSVKPFTLRDFRGKEHHLQDYDSSTLLVIAFLGTECPVAKLYTPKLNKLAQRFQPRGVQFIGVCSNVQDTPTELDAFARIYGVEFPLLKDAGNVVADQVGAERTPEVFLLDQDRVIRYQGRIDDQFGVGYQRPRITSNDLADALESLLAGQPVDPAVTDARGCFIGRVRKVEPHGDITYSNQIARILNRRCAECHREDELAPFPLTTYDEVAPWAETIREVVHDRRMPPWFADPHYGEFLNESTLSDDELQLIDQWVENGAPEGDRSELPDPPTFVTGWRLGEPDAVYHMPKPFQVPAEGPLDYKYFIINPKLTEDVWMTAAEARPGNPSVVHHIVMFALPPGTLFFANNRGDVPGQMVAVYAPGMPPWRYPEGTAMRIEAGSRFVVQMHYTPDGNAQEDRSYVGLQFTEAENVKQKIRYGFAVNTRLRIPPHEPNHEVISRDRFDRDVLLLNLFPHMHYRGKSFKFEALYPDGSREVLLDVPRYDFNWQLRYDLAEPKHLPAGTEMLCTASFDNSSENLVNPDPEKEVRFGLQSYQEMMVGYYTIVHADEDLRTNPQSEK